MSLFFKEVCSIVYLGIGIKSYFLKPKKKTLGPTWTQKTRYILWSEKQLFLRDYRYICGCAGTHYQHHTKKYILVLNIRSVWSTHTSSSAMK